MKLVTGGRGSGKSTHVVRWVAQSPTNRVAVVMNEFVAKLTADAARSMYPDIDRDWTENFVSVHAVGRLRGRDVELYVDELAAVLGALLHSPVAGATVTTTGKVFNLGRRVA